MSVVVFTVRLTSAHGWRQFQAKQAMSRIAYLGGPEQIVPLMYAQLVREVAREAGCWHGSWVGEMEWLDMDEWTKGESA